MLRQLRQGTPNNSCKMNIVSATVERDVVSKCEIEEGHEIADCCMCRMIWFCPRLGKSLREENENNERKQESDGKRSSDV